MPKRVIDFDALWGSDKLASCADWAQAEYAWLYGLADASGCFEMTNLRVIWGRVAAVRGNFTIERLQQVFLEFQDKGLLFVWAHQGKRYAHWTGSDVPGRLPPPSWRMRLEKFAPPVPKALLAEYTGRFARGRAARAGGGFQTAGADGDEGNIKFESSDLKNLRGEKHFSREAGLKDGVEEDQAQDWDLNLELDLKRNGKRELERGAAADGRETGNFGEADEREIGNQGNDKNHNASFYISNANAKSNSTANLIVEANANINPNAYPIANVNVDGYANAIVAVADGKKSENSIAPLNSRSKSIQNSNSSTNALTGLKENSKERVDGRGSAEGHSFRSSESNVNAHCNRDERYGSGQGEGARFNAAGNNNWSAGAYRMSAKEIALERELRVGTGPVCGPARIRPEVLERIRLREEARAKARMGSG